MNISIEAIHFTADQKLLDKIEKKVTKINRYNSRIIEVEVKLKLEGNQKIRDKLVELKVKLKGETLFSKNVSKTFEKATDSGVQNIKRQLEKHKTKLMDK